MTQSDYPRARREGVIVHAAGDDTVVYEIATDRANSLNGAASAVFNLCDGTHSLSAIAAELGQDETVTRLALDRLARANLLENASAFRSPRGSHPSRREILRGAGLGAAASIPIVTSILAPTPAQAATLVGQICKSQTFCDPNGTTGLVCGKPRLGPEPGNCGSDYQCLPMSEVGDCPVWPF